MGTSFDKRGLSRETAENLSDILRKTDRSDFEIQAIDKVGGIFEEAVVGEIAWEPYLGNPNLPDVADAFSITAGLVQYTRDDYTGRWVPTDAPVYKPQWWSRKDGTGNFRVWFLITGVAENPDSNPYGTSKDGLTRTFVAAEIVKGTKWHTEGGVLAPVVLGRRVMLDPRRQFFKAKGSHYLRFEVSTE